MTPFIGYRDEMIAQIRVVSVEMRFLNYYHLYAWFYSGGTPPINWDMELYASI